MILKANKYTSPEPTEGVFENVFITEKSFTIEKNNKYMLITFEMYYFRDTVRVTIDERSIAFYGIAGDTVTSNKLAVISTPNENYDLEIENIPHSILIQNPDYNPEDPASQERILIDNPDYDIQVASVQRNITIPFLQYLYAHEGNLPEVYDVVEWGYPNFEDALKYFDGGDRSNPDIVISNPFARAWLLNTLVMKNEKIGEQFNFVD